MSSPVVRLAVLPVLLAATIAVMAFVGSLFVTTLPPRGFAIVPLTMAPTAALAAAALLVARAQSEADVALRWAAAGLLVASLAMTLTLISFPAVAPGGGVFGIVRQGSLLYFLAHLGLAGGIAAAAFRLTRQLLLPLTILGVGLAFVLAQPLLAPSHPVLMRPDGQFTTSTLALLAVTAAISGVVAGIWIWRSGPRPSATRGWLLIALVLATYEVVLNALGDRRYSELWWASLGLRAGTYLVLLGGLLWVTYQQTGVSEQAVVDAAEGGEVHNWTDATNRLLATARLLADATSPAGVANSLILVCRRILDVPDIAVATMTDDPAAPGWEALAGDSLTGDVRLLLDEVADDPGLIARLRNEAPVFLTGAAAIAQRYGSLGRIGLRTLALVELRTAEGTLGTLIVASRRQRSFSRLERQLLTAVAQQGAQALRRATAEAAQRAIAQTLARLNSDLRDRVATLIETAPDAIVTVNLEGVIIAVNTHSSDMFGYSPQEMLGRSVDILLPVEFRERHARRRQAYAAGPELRPMGVGLSLHARRADGSQFPVEISLAPMRNDEETVILATVRDMTETRNTEAHLREAVERFTAAFEDAPVGMALIGVDGRIARANQALAGMLEYTDDELNGRRLADITDPRDLDDGAMQFADLLAGRIRGYHLEMRLLDRTGSPVWSLISISAIRGDSGIPTHLICHVEDLSDRKHYEGQLLYLADHDPLTGLFNRRRFEQELTRHLTENARYGGVGAVLLLDLDNFKYVNDTLGHSVGDALIRVVATTLRQRLRDSDLVARLGGDEFAILLPAANLTAARQVADSLVEAIRSDGVVGRESQLARTTVSIGVMPLTGSGGEAAEEVIAAADLAMYAAKEQGRDRSEVYEAGGPHVARVEARFRWLEKVRNALDHDQFTLVAQPILDLTTGQITQQELLLRMREGDELVPPALFLYIAERHGLARAIDRWVIHSAIDIAGHTPAGQITPRIELNLSADSLSDPDLPAYIADELRQGNVDPHKLVFEVTETAAIENMDVARSFVEQITDLGCRFALDDFGAGFGSFYYLKYLPFDYLKIDGEFIRQLPTSPADQLIVTSIITAAHGLGKRTIAEYVSDDQTIELLRDLGVDYAQGYHIGVPKPLTQAAEPIPYPRDPAAGAAELPPSSPTSSG